MPEYQAVVTIWVTADDETMAAAQIGARLRPVPYRVERIDIPHAVSGPGPRDEEFRQLACAHQVLGMVRPSWRVIPRDQAERLAAQLLADFTAVHGPPASAEAMAEYARIWARARRV